MTLRRWETWAVNTENGEPVEDRIGCHFTKLGARFRRHVAVSDPITWKVIQEWNRMWPDRRLGVPTFEIRRAA